MTQQVQYTGHGANTGGLQAHSIGDNYPFLIFGRQFDRSRLLWGVLDTRDGTDHGTYIDGKAAQAKVNQLQVADCFPSLNLEADSYEVY